MYIRCWNHPRGKKYFKKRPFTLPSERGRLWHGCASVGASQMGTHASEQDISRYVMWHNVSPCLNPPAARPHATDPAPCLSRCSINNACFSATHTSPVPKVGIGEWMRAMQQMNEPARERDGGGRRMGEGPEAWVTTGGWIRQKKLKDQWTWGWSVLLVPSALVQKRHFLCYFNLRERSAGMGMKKRIKSGIQSEGAVAANGRCSCGRWITTWDWGWVTVLDSITYIHPGTIAVAIWQEAQPLALHKQTSSSLQHLLHRGALSKGMFHFTEPPHAEARAARSASWFSLWPGKCNAACGGQQSCADARFT